MAGYRIGLQLFLIVFSGVTFQASISLNGSWFAPSPVSWRRDLEIRYAIQRRVCGLCRKVSGTGDLYDCVVADAVTYEPVSPAKFPANREINREFRQIRLLDAIFNADARANSEACSKIPYATEQGIFAKNCTREQGI